ncbi:moladietz [Carabus blaptoides fortunei]
MKGWFDAFRCDGGPTLYSFNNRTPVTGDVTIITFLIVFCTLYLAFLVIFPGIRKQRFATFTAVTLSLFVGAAILVSRYGSSWHVASTSVASSYRAFSKEKIVAELGAYVGLNHVNITLRATPSANWTGDIDFNERFLWEKAGQMGHNYNEALKRGMPFPVLTVAEYFSAGQEGFSWGGQYRAAGYFASIMLWTSFASWLLMNLLVAVVPRYGAFLMVVCGGFLLGTNLGYLKMLPEKPLVIHIEGSVLHFRLGWSFWLVLVAGGLCLIAGVVITMVDLIYPHRFSTVLEVDYDTPYDRHVIIEESHDKRYQKKKNSNAKLEEPLGAGLGSRILRRLSSKTREEKIPDRQGVDNQGFEMDPPKSPWRYPFRRAQTVGIVSPGGRVLARTSSQDSASSMGSSVRVNDMPPVHRDLTRSMGLRQQTDKLREVSMW